MKRKKNIYIIEGEKSCVACRLMNVMLNKNMTKLRLN